MHPAAPTHQKYHKEEDHQKKCQTEEFGGIGPASNFKDVQGEGKKPQTSQPLSGKPRKNKGNAKKTDKKKPSQGQKEQSPAHPPPPFLLFDAPCELRTNFLQSQHMQDLDSSAQISTLAMSSCGGDDPNSFHYGMAVNGFHPQLNAQTNPIIPLAGTGGIVQNIDVQPTGLSGNIQLIDGRHGYKGSSFGRSNGCSGGKQRNEREQRRAQKIADLIEDLRLSMVSGGWKVEMKSKYYTLAT